MKFLRFRLDCSVLWLLLAAAVPVHSAPMGPARILVVGDSLSAEYGLPPGSGWVALLEQKLAQEKIPAQVMNASISGDTSAGGASRLAPLLAQQHPSVVIIELGSNDALRGLALAETEKNLEQMARAAQATGARVLLAGMQMPPNYGRDYSAQFAQTFAHAAQQTHALLLPFLLKGVADAPNAQDLFQADRLHPIAAAHPTILANVWPYVKKMLR